MSEDEITANQQTLGIDEQRIDDNLECFQHSEHSLKSHKALCEITESSLRDILSADALLDDIPYDIAIEEVQSQVSACADIIIRSIWIVRACHLRRVASVAWHATVIIIVFSDQCTEFSTRLRLSDYGHWLRKRFCPINQYCTGPSMLVKKNIVVSSSALRS